MLNVTVFCLPLLSPSMPVSSSRSGIITISAITRMYGYVYGHVHVLYMNPLLINRLRTTIISTLLEVLPIG